MRGKQISELAGDGELDKIGARVAGREALDKGVVDRDSEDKEDGVAGVDKILEELAGVRAGQLRPEPGEHKHEHERK